MLAVLAISKEFGPRGQRVQAVDNVPFQMAPRESVAIIGPSGAGKTTLPRLARGHIAPDSVEVRFEGSPILNPGSAAGARFRRRLGFVLQEFGLVEHATALANAMLPLRYSGWRRRAAAVQAPTPQPDGPGERRRGSGEHPVRRATSTCRGGASDGDRTTVGLG
ncbi:MAG: ATP-binding cassette domain-containing protein [Propioniciclava sp.]